MAIFFQLFFSPGRFGDQPYNADAVAALGCGHSFRYPLETLTAKSLRSAVRSLLDDASYHCAMVLFFWKTRVPGSRDEQVGRVTVVKVEFERNFGSQLLGRQMAYKIQKNHGNPGEFFAAMKLKTSRHISFNKQKPGRFFR